MPTPDEKSFHSIRGMFDEISPRYDLLNRLLSLGLDTFWRRRLISGVRGDRVLDLACGSGDVLRRILRKDPSKQVLGLDGSGRMLREARRKLAEDQGISTHFVQGDASRLTFPSGTFDAVTCAFGVRNFEKRSRAFAECFRVLNDGGSFYVLEFFPPRPTILNAPLRWYLRYVLPWIGRLLSGSEQAYEYLQRSIEAFVPPDNLADELRDAGFGNVATSNLFFGLVYLVEARKGGANDARKNP